MEGLGFVRWAIPLTLSVSILISGCGSRSEFLQFQSDYNKLYEKLEKLDRKNIEFCEARKHFVEWQELEDRVFDERPQEGEEMLLFWHLVEARRLAGSIFAASFERGMRKADTFHCEGVALSDSDFIWEGTRILKAYWPKPLSLVELQGLRDLFLEARKKEIYDLGLSYVDPSASLEKRTALRIQMEALIQDALDKNYTGQDLEEEIMLVERLSK